MHIQISRFYFDACLKMLQDKKNLRKQISLTAYHISLFTSSYNLQLLLILLLLLSEGFVVSLTLFFQFSNPSRKLFQTQSMSLLKQLSKSWGYHNCYQSPILIVLYNHANLIDALTLSIIFSFLRPRQCLTEPLVLQDLLLPHSCLQFQYKCHRWDINTSCGSMGRVLLPH